MKPSRIAKLVSGLCCLCASINAQENEREKAVSAEVAIVALGPKPTRQYDSAEGSEEPIMRLAKPDETPPARLFYRGDRDKGKNSRWTSINIAFNSPSPLRKIPADRELKLYRKLSGEDNYEVYATIPPVPATMRRIVFLMPSKYGPTPWKESPAIKTLSLENSDLVDKHFILVNFSKHIVQHAFEDSVEAVAPNKIIAYQRDKVGELYRLAARYGTQKKIIYNTAVRLNSEGDIQLFVLYNGNPGTNAGRDVGVFRMMIPVRKKEIPPE